LKKLEKRFGTKDQSARYRSQLKGRRRQKNESLYTVYDDIGRLVLLAYPGEQSVHRDDFGVEAFIESLDDYQLELYVRSQNHKDLKAAHKHASIMESFTSTRRKKTETDQTNASKKSEKTTVDKYGGRVRSITEDGDIQTTEAFVRQVVDRIQGVIEAKLAPTQPSPIPVLSTVYPGLNYQSPSFYPTPYPIASPPQVGYGVVNAPPISYQVSNAPQVGYNVVIAPQGNNVIPRNISEVATKNTPISAKIYDDKRRCWICNDEKHFASNCPNKALKDNNTT